MNKDRHEVIYEPGPDDEQQGFVDADAWWNPNRTHPVLVEQDEEPPLDEQQAQVDDPTPEETVAVPEGEDAPEEDENLRQIFDDIIGDTAMIPAVVDQTTFDRTAAEKRQNEPGTSSSERPAQMSRREEPPRSWPGPSLNIDGTSLLQSLRRGGTTGPGLDLLNRRESEDERSAFSPHE